jgi:enoyl-CoA hydratase
MLLTGDPISAARAAEVGLVNRLAPEGAALETALELAQAIAKNGPLAVAATKKIARSTFDWTLEQGWKEQSAIGLPVFGSEDAREGATAFAEKRDPVWKNR